MHHKKFKEWMYLAIANEIDSEELNRLMEHLGQCDGCRSEFQDLQQLKTVVGKARGAEPSEDLLWEARRDLSESLNRESAIHSASVPSQPERHGWTAWFPQFRLAFGGLAAVAAGILIGFFVFGGQTPPGGETSPSMLATGDHAMGPSGIANVRFLHVDARDREIVVEYDLVRPVRLRAGVDDARIQRMLVHAMVNGRNAGIRLEAINALDVTVPHDQDKDIKMALIETLRSDPNVGVRKHALQYLYKLPFDDDIKDACLYVLTRDDNPGLRIAAINVLAAAKIEGFVEGGEVYDVLKEELKVRDNNYLRARSGAFIQEVNDVQ